MSCYLASSSWSPHARSSIIKSQGNFLYLVYVLADIRAGKISVGTLDEANKLPIGLRAYYEQHWATMRAQDRDRFERIYKLVLRTRSFYRRAVELIFEVGEAERHQVRFSFNKFWGGLSIDVDGIEMVSQVTMFSAQLVRTYEFVVGDREQHRVRIEKHRERFFAGLRPHRIFAYVDGRQVGHATA